MPLQFARGMIGGLDYGQKSADPRWCNPKRLTVRWGRETRGDGQTAVTAVYATTSRTTTRSSSGPGSASDSWQQRQTSRVAVRLKNFGLCVKDWTECKKKWILFEEREIKRQVQVKRGLPRWPETKVLQQHSQLLLLFNQRALRLKVKVCLHR